MKPQLDEIKETFEFAKLSADSFGAVVTIKPEMIDSVLSLVSQVEAMQQELERITKERNHYRDKYDSVSAGVYLQATQLEQLREELEQVKKERDELQEEVGDLKDANERLVDYEISSLRSELAAKDKALNEGIQKLISALDTRYKESIHKWNAEADMYAQGNADAYDMSEQLVISYLGSILSQYAITPAE